MKIPAGRTLRAISIVGRSDGSRRFLLAGGAIIKNHCGFRWLSRKRTGDSAGLLPYGVLYLGASPAACFWESGLGRDLNSRMPEDMAFSESDLKSRWEYHLRIKPRGLRIFNAGDAVARRSIGAKTAACFSADHAVSRLWAEALMNAGADGILYESTRHSPGLCLALFQTKASMASLSAARRIGSSYDNSSLLAELFTEGVSIMAGNFPITPQKIHDP